MGAKDRHFNKTDTHAIPEPLAKDSMLSEAFSEGQQKNNLAQMEDGTSLTLSLVEGID
jgi:hypothetical protein